jgi:hypothetical protein
LAKRALTELGLLLEPLMEFHHGMQVAFSGFMVMSKSGARTHEIFQIAQNPAKFFRIEDLPGGESRFVFMAIPKGLSEPVPFVIGEEEVDALLTLAEMGSARLHAGGPIPITVMPKGLEKRIPEDRFLMNNGALPLSTSRLNPLVQLLFAEASVLEAYDVRHLFASHAEGAGVPIEIIAAWLNQKSLDVTRYYAKAPQSTSDRWWIRFHSTISLDEFRMSGHGSELQKQAALDSAGALNPVAGGTCTSLGECPIRFKCVGCQFNAPDPDKENQVLDSRAAAVAHRDMWSRHGCMRSVAELERDIVRHDRMLREMELIRQYRQIRSEKLEGKLITDLPEDPTRAAA